MTPERWKEIQQGGGVVNLSGRSKWLMVGEDRIRFLNGQVTQDVRRASAEKAVYGCVTDAKGRVSGDVFVRKTEDGEGLLLDAEEALREVMMARLDRYIVADNVEIQDVTEDWDLVHFFGEAAQGVEGGIECERFGRVGKDLWLARGESARFVAGILSQGEVEILRVLNGVARYPFELNGEVFPPEAGLEERAIDYSKGCYIGQEVISRIRTSKKMPRELVAWRLNEGGEVAVGVQVVLPEEGGRVLGAVTSSVRDPETGFAAGLAYIKLGTVPDDSRLLVGNHLATIRRLVPGLSLRLP